MTLCDIYCDVPGISLCRSIGHVCEDPENLAVVQAQVVHTKYITVCHNLGMTLSKQLAYTSLAKCWSFTQAQAWETYPVVIPGSTSIHALEFSSLLSRSLTVWGLRTKLLCITVFKGMLH